MGFQEADSRREGQNRVGVCEVPTLSPPPTLSQEAAQDSAF